MSTKKNRAADLTLEDVQSRLEDAKADLERARVDLPKAQQAAALAYISRQPYDDTAAARANIARLEYVVCGLEALAIAAEYRELSEQALRLEADRDRVSARVADLRRRDDEALRKQPQWNPESGLLPGQTPHTHALYEAQSELLAVTDELRPIDARREELRAAESAACAEVDAQLTRAA